MSRIIVELMTRDGLTPVLNAQIARAKELQKEYTAAARVARAQNFAATGSWSLPRDSKGGTGGPGGRLGGVFANLQARATTGQLYGMAAPLLAATSVVGVIGKTMASLNEGANLQVQNLATANDIARKMGISLHDSRGIVKSTAKDIAEMGRNLPGETADYQAIFRSVAPSTADIFKDKGEFKARTLELVKRAGIINDRFKTDADQAGTNISAFIRGSKGLGEINQIDFFQKNPEIIAEIRKFATAKGLDANKTKSWSNKQRLDALNEAFKTISPDSIIKEFENTASALQARLRDTIFDQTTGVFGTLREVGSRNDRTAVDAYKGLLQSVVGLYETSKKLAEKFGFSIDPMAALIDVLDLATDGLNRMNLSVSKFVKDGMGFTESWGRTIGDGLGWAVGRIAALIADPRAWKTGILSFFSNLGFLKGLAEGIFWGILRGLGDGLKSAWDGFVTMLRDLFSGLIAKAKSAVGLNAPSGTSGVASFLSSPLAQAATTATQAIPGVKPLMDVGSEILKGVGIGSKTENKQASNTINVTVPGTNASPQEIAQAIGQMYQDYKLTTLTSAA